MRRIAVMLIPEALFLGFFVLGSEGPLRERLMVGLVLAAVAFAIQMLVILKRR